MPEVYDVIKLPGFEFGIRAGEENFKDDLISAFPSEKKSIEKYFTDLRKTAKWFSRYSITQSFPLNLRRLISPLKSIGAGLPLTTTKEYFDNNFEDPNIKAVLAGQWGDYGVPPAESAFAVHAIIVNHYMNGGYYPEGGSKTIADTAVPIIEDNGGDLLVNHEVKEIIVNNGKAIGVKVTEKQGNKLIEKEFFANNIISNAGAFITYERLLAEKNKPPFINEIKNFPCGASHITLYIGLKESPSKLGLKGENYWIYESNNLDDLYRKRNSIVEGEANQAYLSFASLKDPKAQSHYMEIISFIDLEPFKKWQNQPWKNRDEAYNIIKESISKGLLSLTERHFEGFIKMVDYRELSTPLSTVFFTGNRGGNIYGIPAVPQRYKVEWISPRTHIKNLYLTGTDATSHGIVGAMMGGAVSAGIILGYPLGISKVFKEAMKFQE